MMMTMTMLLLRYPSWWLAYLL